MLKTFLFDQVLDRSQSNSDKWDKYPANVIPMWVADMDFDSPPCIKEALAERVAAGVFGYTHVGKSLNEAIINHCQRRYNWTPSSAHLVHLPGLVCALHLSVRTFSEPGERIIVPGPVYYHLTRAPEFSGRELHRVPLIEQDQRWVVDMSELAHACAAPNAKMILLCNPHNPGGTVYSREELLAIHDIAQKYDLIVVSDEIHCDLILEDVQHIPYASLNEDAAQRSIVLMSPSKTFNVAGLGYAYAIIANTELRNAFNHARNALIPMPNLLALTAAEAAYDQGEEWRRELVSYLNGNREYIQRSIAGTGLTMLNSDATYLAWIDCKSLHLEDPHAFFLAAGVGTSPGKDFGAPQFIRLNFGCPRSILEEAMARILAAIKAL